MKRYYFYLLLLLNFCSCSVMRANKREMTITSNPVGSEVSYLTHDTQEFKVLGVTPLTVTSEQMASWSEHGQDYVALRLLKPGHVVETLLVDLTGRYNVNYQSELKPVDIWHHKEEEVSSSAANKLAMKVQKINHLIYKKDLESALTNTIGLIEQFPKAHVFYDIKGSILFLMGKKNEGMASYQKSLSLQPDNHGTQEMLDKVKGVRQ
jgi:hypothetical protein